MTPEEFEDWRRVPAGHGLPADPCDDCTLGFAADMRAIGRCDGRPGGAQEDDEPLLAREGRTMTTIRANVTAPCGRCIHREVCGRRAALDELGAVPVDMERLPDGVTASLAVAIECDAFATTKSHHRVTPASLGAARANAAKGRAALAARRLAELAEQAEAVPA